MHDQLARYHRQMLLPGIGVEGQQRLRDATVLLLGCGAIGSVAADLLARAGVGHLMIADRDFVELTNLQRQVLFDERDVAESMPKAAAAKRRLAAINSQVRVTAIVDDINHTNIQRLANGADVLVDGLDNFETRYLANDLAVKSGRPYLYGAAVATAGMAFAVVPQSSTACLRCLFDEPPPPGTSPTCHTAGVISPAVAMVANFQVTEVIKILTGNLDRVASTLLNFDLWANEIMQLGTGQARARGDCPCCGRGQFEYLDGSRASSATALCGNDAVQLRQAASDGHFDLEAVAARLGKQVRTHVNEYMMRAHIVDGGSPYEVTLFANGRAIVKGTQDVSMARGILSKYIGV